MADDLDGVPRYTHEPDPSAALMKMIKALSSRIDVMERTAPKFYSITGPDGSKLSFDPVRMAGFNAAGVEMFRLSTADGAATFNGPLNIGGAARITGTLSLPAGIIDNDALSNPINYGSVGASEGSFSIDTTHRKRAVQAITIPPGFSQATVLVVANVNASNTTSSGDYLYAQAYAASGIGASSIQPIAASGGIGSASASAIQTLTGLSGGTIEVGSYVYCAFGPWSATAYNQANVNAIVWFTR